MLSSLSSHDFIRINTDCGRWVDMNENERQLVREELKYMVNTWRMLKQNRQDCYASKF